MRTDTTNGRYLIYNNGQILFNTDYFECPMITITIDDDTCRTVFSQPSDVDKVLMKNPMCSSGITDDDNYYLEYDLEQIQTPSSLIKYKR